MSVVLERGSELKCLGTGSDHTIFYKRVQSFCDLALKNSLNFYGKNYSKANMPSVEVGSCYL